MKHELELQRDELEMTIATEPRGEPGLELEPELEPELDRLPGRRWLKRHQGEPLGEFFLRLLDEWAKERASLGQESPVLSVRALNKDGRPALEIILRNGSRWIVPRRER